MCNTISKGRSTIDFDRLSKCPTGHLTGVTIKSIDDVGAITDSKMRERSTMRKGICCPYNLM